MTELKTAKYEDYVVRMRRHFHRNPELSFKEFRTAETIEKELRGMGLESRRVAETCIAADIEGSSPGRTVAIRADIDALPVKEENSLEFKSSAEGVMHACGHDAHIAMALGAARYFAENRDSFTGRIRMLFQAAEESPPGGAKQLIEAGELKDVDYVIGQHVVSRFPSGTTAVYYGPMMANADEFIVRIKGVGGHGSAPQEAIDALMIAANYVMQIQTIVSRRVAPFKSAVVTVGTFNSGYRYNIIAPYAELTGTVRTFDSDVQDLVKEELEKILKGVALGTGCEYEFEYIKGYPAVINNNNVSKVFEDISHDVLGKDSVLHPEPDMGGEDFAYYVMEKPGAFYFLGVGNQKKGATSPQHSPTYMIDEDAMKYGVEILCRSALRLLEGGA